MPNIQSKPSAIYPLNPGRMLMKLNETNCPHKTVTMNIRSRARS